MKTEYIKTELAKYSLSDARIAEMRVNCMCIIVKDPKDMDSYVDCREKYKMVHEIRMGIEAKRKELKASSLEFGRAVDGEAKRLTKGVREIEDHLMEQRKVVEDEKKRIEEAKIQAEKDEKEKDRREEEARLETQRKEQEIIRRQLKEAQDKLDADKKAIEEEREANRLERERLEYAALEAEEAKEEAVREEKERKEKIIQDEKDRKEAEEKYRKDVAQAKIDATNEAIKQEQERVAALKAAKLEAEREANRQEELKPDIEKLQRLAVDLAAISIPKNLGPGALLVATKVFDALKKIIAYIDNIQL